MPGAVSPGAAAMFSARGTETAASEVISVQRGHKKICGSCSHNGRTCVPRVPACRNATTPGRMVDQAEENAEEKAEGGHGAATPRASSSEERVQAGLEGRLNWRKRLED